jgi:hypothetical protein
MLSPVSRVTVHPAEPVGPSAGIGVTEVTVVLKRMMS